jgi:hypothetical protein
MDAALQNLLDRANAQLEKGQYKACEATLAAAKVLKAQQASGKGTEIATRRAIDELGQAIGYDPNAGNPYADGTFGSVGGNPWPGRKNLVAPHTVSVTEKEAEALHAAAMSRSTLRVNLKHRTKLDPTGPIIGQPPATVAQGVQPLPFAREPSRIMDLIPLSLAPSAYLQYFSTTGGTAAAAVAEGAMKPESFPRWARIDVRATKIATFVEASEESVQDFPNFLQLLGADLTASLIDAENRELLSAIADATVHGWNGLLATSGTLSRTRGTETPLDTLEMAVSDLRTGPAFTRPTGIVLHPTDWSAIRRSKDLQNRYLATDPLVGAADTLWGTPVIQTTQVTLGTAVVANFGEACLAYSVDSLRLDLDRGGEAFKKNLIVLRAEERLILTVPRPAALVVVDGL